MGIGQKELLFIFFMLSSCLRMALSSSSKTKTSRFTLAMASSSLKESNLVFANNDSPKIAHSIFSSNMFLLISNCLCKISCSFCKGPISLKVLLKRLLDSSFTSIVVVDAPSIFKISTYNINVNNIFKMGRKL